MSNPIEINSLNIKFEAESPGEILQWACKTFSLDKIATTSSFQSQSVPLLHQISKYTPGLLVYFIDTGFHFPETLIFRDQLVSEFGLNIKILKSRRLSESNGRQTRELYRDNSDLCCYINKVKPFKDVKGKLKAWVTGIRRDQTKVREKTPVLSIDSDGLYKICPMAAWNHEEIWSYITEYDLPVHPLFYKGYRSIGCMPCTRPVLPDESERDGRWPDEIKTECGLHISIDNESVD